MYILVVQYMEFEQENLDSRVRLLPPLSVVTIEGNRIAAEIYKIILLLVVHTLIPANLWEANNIPVFVHLLVICASCCSHQASLPSTHPRKEGDKDQVIRAHTLGSVDDW